MRHVTLLIAFPVIVSGKLLAQDVAALRDSTPCTYDACALRFEGRLLTRGLSREPVLHLGAWGAPRLRPFVGPSDSAQRYAAEFDHHYTIGQRLWGIGFVGMNALTALLLVDYGRGERWSDQTFYRGGAAALVSLGFMIYGRGRLNRAFSALGGAIWWANRELSP